MRRFLAFLGMCALSCTAQADLVTRSAKSELRLQPSACTSPAVLALLKAEWHGKFRAATGHLQGAPFQACWIDDGQGSYIVIFDDGSGTAMPVSGFTEPPNT